MSYRYCLSICMSVPEIIHIVCVCVAGGGCICETKFKISPCLYAAAF